MSYEGEEILVGGLALMAEHGMTGGLPTPGDGADGASEVYVARSGRVLASIRIADVLRPEAKNAIAVAAMRQMGLNTNNKLFSFLARDRNRVRLFGNGRLVCKGGLLRRSSCT